MEELKEVWKDIQSYEGKYQISNLGRVKSLYKLVVTRGKTVKVYKEKMLKGKINNCGYDVVCLYKDNIRKEFMKHRLVACAFVENDDKDKIQVNHIDGNKQNNNVNNLEWVTASENGFHKYRVLYPYKVYQYDLEGNFLKEFINSKNAMELTGVDRSCIIKVINHKRKTAGGFVWMKERNDKN